MEIKFASDLRGSQIPTERLHSEQERTIKLTESFPCNSHIPGTLFFNPKRIKTLSSNPGFGLYSDLTPVKAVL
jgi:hypothetical protein